MKKPFQLAAVAVLTVVLVYSCKTQEVVTATTPDPNEQGSDYVPDEQQRHDPITEKKAIEEATFMDGCIYKMIDNKRAALGQFQEVLNMNPDNAAANYEVAGLYNDLGQPDRALKYASEAVRLQPDNVWYKVRYAEVLQATHRDGEAIAIYQDLIKAEPDNLDYRYRLADCQAKAEKYDEALTTYSEIEKMDGNSDTLARCRIRTYESKKDDAGIENTLKGLTVTFPNSEDYYYELTDFYEAHNQQEKANEIYKSMEKKFPYSATPHLKLAEVDKAKGQEAEAYKEAMAAFSIPEQLDNKIAYLNKWYPIGDTAAALSPAKKREADSLCSVMRRTHRDDARSYTLSGDYMLKSGRSKDARVQYRKAIDLSKESYGPWRQLLILNDESKDDVQQEKDCKEVLELFPTQPDAYFYLGSIQFRKKNYDGALYNLQTAMDYNLDRPEMDREIRVMMIDIHRAKGETADADALVEKMSKLEPDNLEWKFQLAQSLLAQEKEYYRAEQMMIKVVEKDSTNSEYLSLLGWIEFSMGDYKMASDYMTQALAISPNNAKMNERMGDIQFRLKNTDEAVKYWNKAKAQGGTSPALEEKIKTKTLKDE